MVHVAAGPHVVFHLDALGAVVVVLLLDLLQPGCFCCFHLFLVCAGCVALEGRVVDLEERLAIGERCKNTLRPLGVAADEEARREGFNTVKTPGLAIVGRVRSNEVREKSLMRASNLAKRHFINAVPARFDDGCAILFADLAVGRADDGLGFGGDDDALVLLSDVQLAHQAQADELLAGAALRVAVVEVPGGCFEGWAFAAAETVFAFGVGVLRKSLLRPVGAFAALVVHVFLVADHGGGLLISLWLLLVLVSVVARGCCLEGSRTGSSGAVSGR